jgi:signal transduction histidine kinase
LQMQFVAGVSHELRTPVTVMCAAADNLAEGFVGSREQVKEYGALIRNEGRKLAGMIEQILHFAASQAGRTVYELRPVHVPELVSAALDQVAALPEANGFTLERAIDPDLPPVHADSAALTRCLQNLVVNAVKYGGANRWAIVRAQKSGHNGAMRVRISVEDKGLGIEAADLPHIFDAFYRGKAAEAAQIRGTGLGLNLAREIAQHMGGSLTVSSQPGRGSIFTLDLPAEPEVPGVLPRTA